MKSLLAFLIFLAVVNSANAQDTCASIKITISEFDELIKGYEQDSINFTQDIAKYSKLKGKSNREKYNKAVEFLDIAKKIQLWAIEGKKQWLAKLENCSEAKN
ncbi:hypothetical protein M0G43_10150 [Subsaxibacter sp. CAU 1640]|uniref:hypothetical protein n=1 Tax=Subsaxibacter sp. CAU 1640 TaxID=2933271 RepID=UPI002005859F|nr:hypothetical protein [Subsaxibacter sp. CAU 1640]MCK7590933.1 hypothetical protein [Subsaxibacter sp. CAU 1640]